MRLGRRGELLRNLLLTAFLLLLAWAALNFPALTAWGELRRGEEAALVEGFQLVGQDKSYYGVNRVFGRRDNCYLLISSYDAAIWGPQRYVLLADTEEGYLLVQRMMQEEFLLLGETAEVAEATLLMKNQESGETIRGNLEGRTRGKLLYFSVPGILENFEWEPAEWTAFLTLYDGEETLLRELELPCELK